MTKVSEGKKGILLASACLVGFNCRWDGELLKKAPDQLRDVSFIPICPEMLAGFGCPRARCELIGGDGDEALSGRAEVITENDSRETARFVKVAETIMKICEICGIKEAVLKEKSPSCGVNRVYVDGKLVKGKGVTAARLSAGGIKIIGVKSK